MTKTITAWVLASSTLFVSVASAYEKPVHRRMSAFAFRRLVERGLLDRLGLLDSDAFSRSAFLPERFAGSHTAFEWIVQGSADEDNFPRPVNHFYDPTTGSGLSVEVQLGAPAVDWALGRGLGIDNEFGLPVARQKLLRAVTGDSEGIRDVAWADLFYTLGHLVHLVQDMAQPQHVRNDPHLHPGGIDPFLDRVFYDFSRYERYTLLRLGTYNYEGYPTVQLPSYEAYWKELACKTSDGQCLGMADLGNAHFVSADTNLDSGKYTSPSEADSSFDEIVDESITFYAREGGSLVARTETFPVLYRRYEFEDPVRRSPVVNPRLSAFSAFDFLTEQTRSRRAYTLDHSNFDAHAELLLPRAVGYSAGFLDRFFRGRIEITPPFDEVYGAVDQQRSDGEPVAFRSLLMNLRNATPPLEVPGQPPVEQTMNGTLTAVVTYNRNGCYEDDLSGEVYQNGTIPSGCSLSTYRGAQSIARSREIPIDELRTEFPREFRFDFTDEPIPVDARDIFLRVVFQGRLGDEEDAILVSSKDLSEPTFISFVNATDFYLLDGVFYPPDVILNDPDLLSRVDSNPTLAAERVRSQPIDGVEIHINDRLLARTPSIPVQGYTRVAVLTERESYRITATLPASFATAELEGQPFESFLNRETKQLMVDFHERYRGLPYFLIFKGFKKTGTLPGDESTLPPLNPFFVASEIIPF